MLSAVRWAGVAALVGCGPLAAQRKPAPPATIRPSLVILHATVVDAGGLRPDQAVVIGGGRILHVGPRPDTSAVPRGTPMVDARGLYLIPGLWDMHVHLTFFGSARLPLFTVNGVTGVLDLSGVPDSLTAWKHQIETGARLGPRITMSGRILRGAVGGAAPWAAAVTTGEEARAAVRANQQAGADVIKVWSTIPREAYLAALDEARRARLPLVGHLPVSVSFAEAIDGGQRGIEHLIGLPIPMSPAEDSLLTSLRARVQASKDLNQVLTALITTDAAAIATVDSARRDRVLSQLAGSAVSVTPTLTDLHAYTVMRDSLAGDQRLTFLPPAMREGWLAEAHAMSDTDLGAWKSLFRFGVDLVGRMKRAGVRVLPGTDAGSAGDFPGSDLHNELALLVQAGMTPLEALSAATVRSAEAAGLRDQAGLVVEGQLADLVFLEANPLADIRNTRRVVGVIQAGRYLDRRELSDLRRRLAAQ